MKTRGLTSITIIIIALILLGIVAVGGYLLLKPSKNIFKHPVKHIFPPPVKNRQKGYCGDGICGLVEKQKGACPQDCKLEEAPKTCSQQNGDICSADEICEGFFLDALDSDKCCNEKCQTTSVSCEENWQCTSWSNCTNSKQTRICTDSNNCGTDINKPSESQSCQEPLPLVSQISPFGIHGENQYSFDNELNNVGIKVVRYSGGLPSWDKIERTEGNLNWSELDSLVETTYTNNIEIMLTVLSFNRWDQGGVIQRKFPNDIEGYKNFLRTMAERYDGDGKSDAPGSPIVTYYQIENEVDGNFWDDTPEKYAELLGIAYDTVKEANPNAKVLIAGMSEPEAINDFYSDILNNLNKTSFDIFDLHWYGNADEYNNLKGYSFKSTISTIKNKAGNVPIWISETGTYGGKDVVSQTGQLLPQQNEKVQASNLVKRYIYYISNDIDVVMWYKMMEVHHTGKGISNDYFENTGLINNPQNSDGLSHKKLAYYTYKLMVEKLEGSDWNNIEAIIDGENNVYAYKFIKKDTGKIIYVVWWDYFNDSENNKTISLNVDFTDSVLITEAVPDADDGSTLNENNYPDFFNTETKTVQNGKITITLDESPLFIEEN